MARNGIQKLNKISPEIAEKTKPSISIYDALSNFLVLKSIFSHLNPNDLESCCNVNSLWRSVANPLIFRYDVRLVRVHVRHESSSDPFDKEDHVVLQERATQNNNNPQECKLSIKDACKLIKEASHSRKLVLHLRVADYGHTEVFNHFLSILGPLVLSCSPEGSQMTVSDLCKRLLRDFPNLQELDISNYFFYPGYDVFNTSIPENQLKFLRKIDTKGFELKNYDCLAKLLRFGPNLEEIHNFPILLVESLVVTGKGGLVRSLQYQVGERQELNEDTFAKALEKLAKLEPQLHSFSFHPPYKMCQEFLYSSGIKPFVYKILKSSHASLKSLTIFQSESFDFQRIPPFTSLEEITFIFSESDTLQDAKFFAPNLNLLRSFPNVRTVKILRALDKYVVNKYFPESVFRHWGTQIRRLEIRTVSSNAIQGLSRLFPSVKELVVYIAKIPDNLHSVLAAISEFWPGITMLTIKVDCLYPSYGQPRHQNCTLDSAFTGIPDDLVMELKVPLCRGKFTEQETRNFEETSMIRTFTDLKILELDVSHPHVEPTAFERLSTLTRISHEFGFKFLPDLKLIVRTRKYFDCGAVQEVKSSLEPLMKFELEKGVY